MRAKIYNEIRFDFETLNQIANASSEKKKSDIDEEEEEKKKRTDKKKTNW